MMNAGNPPGEAAPAPDPPPVPAAPHTRTTSRLVAGLVGLILLAIMVSDVHLALVGIAGAGAAWQVQRVRRRAYTGTAAWIGAVSLTGAAFVVTLVVLTAKAPAGTLDTVMQKAQQDQATRPRPRPPAILERFAPGVQPSPAADSLSQRMIRSRPFTILILASTALMGAGIAGVALGTLAWAAVMALLFAAFGRWRFAAPAPAPPA